MSDLSIFKLDTQTINIKDTTAREAADSAKTLATTASGNATTALNKINELESEKADAIISSASGAIASFPDGAESTAKKLVVGIEPVQDLHGYDSPWPAGGGKNLLPAGAAGTFTDSGMTVVSDGKGNYRFYGTSTANSTIVVAIEEVTLPDTVFMYMLNSSASVQCALVLAYGETQLATPSMGTVNKIIDVSAGAGGKTINRLRFYINIGNTVDITLSPMLCVDATVRSFSPYSNICPITGWTGCVISHSGADTSNPTTYPITFPTEAGTVYGGSLDVTTGVLTVDRAQIASYAGETLPSTWISDRDVYSAGATPTTGAQVVYELATPITYHLTPQEITTLLGQNNIWADTGDTSVTYKADTKIYIDKKFTELQALILEN